MKGRRAFLALPLLLALASCSGSLVNIAPAPPEQYVKTGPAEGTACGILPMGMSSANSRAERAYQQALETSGGATGLTDTHVSERWSFVGIGLMVCTTIEGVGFKPVAGN